MNSVQAKNNRYKNGWYNPSHTEAMLKEKAMQISPTQKQLKYRDDLYNFCSQKGILKSGFPLSRTKKGITSNIRAFITIIEKNGLTDEFFGERKEK